MEVDALISLFSSAAQSQIAQMGFFFTLAAWLHSGRVKKEIRANFDGFSLALDKVVGSIREDLKCQDEVLDNIKTRVGTIENNCKKGEICLKEQNLPNSSMAAQEV